MTCAGLRITRQPKLNDGRMLLALTGWMDGGDVSTGTVRGFIDQFAAPEVATLDPQGYYLENFPGTMEVTAIFRPHVRIEDGLIVDLEFPVNTFHCDDERGLLFFVGKEPNLGWQSFADCVLDFAQQSGVTSLYFVGSFAGLVPHTREPRLYGTVSDEGLKPLLLQHGVRLSSYEGPASFATFLMTQATQRGLQMVSLVAEIPGYMEGTNPLSIEAVTRRLTAILGLPLDLSLMRRASDEWESRVSAAVQERPDLARRIRKLEERYDDELIDKPAAEEDEDLEEDEDEDEDEDLEDEDDEDEDEDEEDEENEEDEGGEGRRGG